MKPLCTSCKQPFEIQTGYWRCNQCDSSHITDTQTYHLCFYNARFELLGVGLRDRSLANNNATTLTDTTTDNRIRTEFIPIPMDDAFNEAAEQTMQRLLVLMAFQ